MSGNNNSKRAIKWAKDNPDKYKENQKRYRDKKRELMTDIEKEQLRSIYRERNKQYRLNNPDIIKKIKNDYIKKRRKIDEEFRNKINQRSQIWREKNIDHIKQYSKDRYDREYPIKKSTISKNNRIRRINRKLEVIYWYSNGTMRCECCGELQYEFLAIDHIYNNGYNHRQSGELKRYSNDIINYLISNDFPEGYQILCHNCNQIKYIDTIIPKDSAYTRYRYKYRNLMLMKYSNNDMKCKCCGMEDTRCLTFHHVNGGGTEEKRLKGYTSLAIYLYQNNISLSEIEILCQNCNKSLGHFGYCPHND